MDDKGHEYDRQMRREKWMLAVGVAWFFLTMHLIGIAIDCGAW